MPNLTIQGFTNNPIFIMISIILSSVVIALPFFFLYKEQKIRRENEDRRYKNADKRLDAEHKAKMANEEWLKNQSAELLGLSKPISKHLKEQLLENTSWLSNAIIKSGLKEPKNVFEDRLDHFGDEKKFIADKFVPYINRKM